MKVAQSRVLRTCDVMSRLVPFLLFEVARELSFEIKILSYHRVSYMLMC